MSAFNPYWECTYDEIVRYYPRYYKDIKEMDAILRAEGSLADGVDRGIERVLMNNFIDTADAQTLEKYEAFWGLALMKQRTIEERRRYIKSSIAGTGKVSQTRIKEMIHAYTGADTQCDFYIFDDKGNNRLDILFDRGEEKTIYISDIYTLLAKMLPAHIEYRAIVVYRFGIEVGSAKTNYTIAYQLCGIKPEIALLAEANTIIANTEAIIKPNTVDYKFNKENDLVSGTVPQTLLLARGIYIEAVTGKEVSEICIEYKPSEESGEESGTYPEMQLLAQQEQISTEATTEISEERNDYKLSGTLP